MLAYQLEAAVLLVICAILSSIRFVLLKDRGGKIQLPLQNVRDRRNFDEDVGKNDPFDVVEAEDVVAGYPVEELVGPYEKKIQIWKTCSAVLLGLTVLVEGTSLGWSIMSGNSSETATFALRICFSLYLLIVSVTAIGCTEPRQHSELVIHLGLLTAVCSLVLFITAIMPTSLAASSASLINTPNGLLVTSLILYIASCASFVFLPMGPPLRYPVEQIYDPKVVAKITNLDRANVTGYYNASIVEYLLFSYTGKVVQLGNIAESVEISDLPILPADHRATYSFRKISEATKRSISLPGISWSPKPGSGLTLAWQIFRSNKGYLVAEIVLAVVIGVLFYVPYIFIRGLINYIEDHPDRGDPRLGWFYVIGTFLSKVFVYLCTGQLVSIGMSTLYVRIKVQITSMLYLKTLVRKDIAGAATSPEKSENVTGGNKGGSGDDSVEGDFATKGQIFTLFTTDADRIGQLSLHLFPLIDAPMEIIVGTIFLYNLLGLSCFFGLLVLVLFIPLNHWANKIVFGAQDKLMKKRDERMTLMNEILGAIRMLKFMAWERRFEERVIKIRNMELKYQRLSYIIESLFTFIWEVQPILVAVVSFWHYAGVRKEPLTPAVAFTSILIFNEMKFALSIIPETLIQLTQSFVSLRRVERYLITPDVTLVSSQESQNVGFRSCTVTWPQLRNGGSSLPSVSSTPRQFFTLRDLNIDFPEGELSLICGKLGSGKTLLLLALLGEADVLTGQVLCPHTPPTSVALFSKSVDISNRDWIVSGISAYVPQVAWLRNASIKENILFSLPYNAQRYRRTIEICALTSDFDVLEDGDESEIGERGVNLSGGQKARVSLARAVYSRASIRLLLDDVLSAVDAHTAAHLYHECLKGDLMSGRTVILVSHHVQLCAPGAGFIVALEDGLPTFVGDSEDFGKSAVKTRLIQSDEGIKNDSANTVGDESIGNNLQEHPQGIETVAPKTNAKEKAPPRKFIEEEKRAVGRIGRKVYRLYLTSMGHHLYWAIFLLAFIIAALMPVVNNGWIRYWSDAVVTDPHRHPTTFYIGIYAAVTVTGAFLQTIRWFTTFYGSLRASRSLYQDLLHAVMFANIRFHDTISRGRLLNRFGTDFEGIDSRMSGHFGRTFSALLSILTTLITVSVVGGPLFLIAAVLVGAVYYHVGKMYGQASRDMRRLDSVTKSPLYSLFGETISGVAVIRGFGASTKFLRDMLKFVDTNINAFYWQWGVNRWLGVRFNLLSSAMVGITAAVCVLNGAVTSAFTGFILTFASSINLELLFAVRRFVQMEQSMVALERVKEYSDLPLEAVEFMEPRPPPNWPSKGVVHCENLVVRYAPELPDVLHNINFEIQAGQKIGVLGRTGSGKSTLAMSFFRFVETTQGRILVDDVDISKVGLTDLRSRFTIIPQEPTILSGTLRSTLDVFEEYEDSKLYEALRRVQLIPSEESQDESQPNDGEDGNANVFRDLDSPVSEGGDNFSTGEKQLLCMARAILRQSKLLVMDEATASVDYRTDQLISATIREEFADSTILTIAHRLRTIIDYDKVMILDQGSIVEFDKPAKLLQDRHSRFYSLCKASGSDEFAMLLKLAGV